jgi:dihydrofolate reductase
VAEAPARAKSLTVVAALGCNGAIGLDGAMPWHLPAELAHFKQTTMGRSIVMGRKTWEAIGKALPGRQNIVVSRNPDFLAPNADVASSLDEAIAIAESEEVMIVGGASLYEHALPAASRMVLTHIDCEPEADTWFPKWNEADWEITSRKSFEPGDRNNLAFEVVEYRRKRT